MGHPCHKSQIVALKRIEGQIRGIQKMIDDGKYCVDILTQIQAAIASLASVEGKVLEVHLDSCVNEAMANNNVVERQEKIKEIAQLMKRCRKSCR